VYTSRTTSPLCSSVHTDCSPATWCPRSAGQFQSWGGSFLLKVLHTYTPPLGTSLQQRLLPNGSGQGAVLVLHDSASLVTVDWIGTWSKGGSSTGRWTGPTRLSGFGHRDGSQRGVGTGKKKGEQRASWDGFSAVHTAMRKQRMLGGQGKQENWADIQRETEESPYGERMQEKARVSWLSPALSHMGAVFSFCEMALYSLHHPPHFWASLNRFLVLAKVFD